jgi:nicotinamide mononucleotide adenylyltransferase
MLQRNLLYTAVTRAKRIVVLVGSKRALAKAVRTQGAGRRYTALTERLRPGQAGLPQRPAGRSAGQLQQAPVLPRQRARSGQMAVR